MKRVRLTVLLVAALLAALTTGTGSSFAAGPGAPAAGKVRPDYYIVVLKDGTPSAGAVAGELAARHGLDVESVYENALKGFAARIPAQRLAQVKADSRVLFVSEDREVHATAQTLPTGVNRIEGDLSSTASGNGSGSVNVGVAVVDTGIQTNHPDLNVVGGKSCIWFSNSFNDGNGHGTHVAGTIAARDNTTGVVGMAPGAPLYAVRVLDSSGSGFTSWITCGLDWVAANAASKNIKVANMSLGGSGSDDGNCGNSNGDAMHKSICNLVSKGVTVVVAAGNSNADLATFTPAAYNEVLTVTAVSDSDGQPGATGGAPTCRTGETDDAAATFSNWTTSGSADAGHTIAAPGVCIYSTWTGSGYNTISGTSMASPHVTGTVALCVSRPQTSGGCSGMSPSQIINKLRADAAGRLNYGFSAPSGHYYGDLVYAGGY